MSGYIDWDAIDRERLRNMPGAEPITDAGRSPAPALSPEEQRVVAQFEAAPVIEEAWRADEEEQWTATVHVCPHCASRPADEHMQTAAGLLPDSVPAYYRGPAIRAIAAALAAAEQRGRDETTRKDTIALRDALRIHHPVMRSETGPFSGCRCGQVRLGQNVIAHVVERLRAALDAE